jgi:predicted membrane protein
MKSNTNRLVGGVIIAVGALILIGNIFGGFDFWDFIWKLWPVVLIVLGVYLIKNQRRISGDFKSGDYSSESSLFGDLDISLSGKEIADQHYSTLFGDIKIDLLDADFKTGENRIGVSALVGDIKIKIPDNLSVRLSSRSIIGDIRFDDLRRDGFFQRLDHIDNNFGSSEKRLSLSVSGIIGDLNVNRIKTDDVN